METQFYIMLSLKTPQGFVNYGQFFLGTERHAAYRLFGHMQGSEKLSAPLHIDLMETVDELPVRIKTICGTLEEMGANCQLITRELFRLKNLEELV